MEVKNIRAKEIVVALQNMQTCQGGYPIEKGTIDIVTAEGYGSDCGRNKWVIRLKSCDNDYYYQYHDDKDLSTSRFRIATIEEKVDFQKKGVHKIYLLPFGEDDYVIAETEIFTTDKSFRVPAGFIGKVDNIIEKKNTKESVFWFNTHHSGWFRFDGFRKATKEEVIEKQRSQMLLSGIIEGLKNQAQEVLL